ncbi:MAG: secondary thiamine-phosphate synthase enzyme YjbQ [Candidatus Sulfotelmatobacter sp.]
MSRPGCASAGPTYFVPTVMAAKTQSPIAPIGKSGPLTSAKQSPIDETGEDNGDSHLKALLIHHEVIVPITAGKLDLGTWQRIFYAEFDGQRDKRVIVKVMGE